MIKDILLNSKNNTLETPKADFENVTEKLVEEMKFNLEKTFLNYYQELMHINFKGNTLEILLPTFLDDTAQINLYVTFKSEEIVLSSNLIYSLEKSLYEKTQYDKNILKDFIMKKSEYIELKTALKKEGVNPDSLTLECIKKSNEELNIFESIIIYSELSKAFYNNLYHSLINRLSKPHEKHNIFYNNFNKIVKTVTEKVKLTKYEEKTVSTNPIYTGNNIILSASKDFDSLGLLYIDLLTIKEKAKKNQTTLVFVESEKTKDKIKLGAMINRFKGSGFEIKEIAKNKMSDIKILNEIEKRFNDEKSI